MNNMYPFMNGMPTPNNGMSMPLPNNGMIPFSKEISDEINKLKNEIDMLKERVKRLENNKKNTFLQKDDGFYMM